jgi:hypothetical protein
MQLICLSFKKKIYNDATPANLIVATDTVQVRLRAGCGSCDSPGVGPNVPSEALGCDHQATLDANSEYVLDTQTPSAPCVGAVVSLVAESVTSDGRGFCFDRTLPGQNYRAIDIDMVMPDHDGIGCDGSS